MRRRIAIPMLAAFCAADACDPGGRQDSAVAQDSAVVTTSAASALPVGKRLAASPGFMQVKRLRNRVAYIPPQCFTKTRGDDGKPKNPCTRATLARRRRTSSTTMTCR